MTSNAIERVDTEQSEARDLDEDARMNAPDGVVRTCLDIPSRSMSAHSIFVELGETIVHEGSPNRCETPFTHSIRHVP